MQKLSKQQSERLATLCGELREAEDEVNDAFDTLDSCVSEYNQKADEVNEFLREVEGDIDNYINEQSEQWQESERGEAYSSWLEEWALSVDPIEVERPEIPIDVDTVEGLPEEPEL